jgi:hypothetical protein
MTHDGRRMDFSGVGPKEGMEAVQGLILGYAQENMEKVAQALAVYGLSGEPALLAPHRVRMRRQTARMRRCSRETF